MQLIGRRNFISGLGLGAGAHLLGGFVRSVLPEARGQLTTGPRRLILFSAANGFLESFYTGKVRNETDFDLGPVYAPVAAWKNQMIVAHKFFNPFSKALHGNQHATLTVMESTNPNVSQMRGPPGGISIDRLIGKSIGAKDAFSSTASGRGICVSADGPGQSVPLISSPAKAFSTYLGGATVTPGMTGMAESFEKGFIANKSFLDLLRTDIGRLNGRLAVAERAKLEQYLESLRNLEAQIALRGQQQSGCSKPEAPVDGSALDVSIKQHIDIVFAAQRCNLTHVSHIAFEGMEGPHIVYNWLNDPRNHHDDHHAKDMGILQKIATWWFERIGQMLTHLAGTREGDGTMLDNSLVMFLNTCGGSHHRGYDNHPLILWGGAGGKLRTGRYLQYAQGQHCISDAYLSIAKLFGLPIDKFGSPQHNKGPLPGLV